MSWLTEPDWDVEPEQPKSRVKLIALILAGWLIVSLLVLAALLGFTGHSSGKSSGGSSSVAAAAPTATPSPSPTDALPDGWVQQAADDQTDCAAHAYGEVVAFFTKTPCVSVRRTLATTNQGGRTVVVASNVVTFKTAAQAKQYLALVDADGTGNISDLLREGVTYPGGPAKLPDAAFASALRGTQVRVSEAAYTTGASANGDAVLERVAQAGVDA